MASWEQIGDLRNVAQLRSLDAVRLIVMIAQAAATGRMHRSNCRQFAQRLTRIGNLLEQLKISELKRRPVTREPLEQLEDALRQYFVLVDSCQNMSYLYLLAMGWSIGYQFRKAQSEIDRYLLIVPLIMWVHNARIRERLEYIERDEQEYTLNDEDKRVQEAILDSFSALNTSTVSSSCDLISNRGSRGHEEWSSYLFDCCPDPYLYLRDDNQFFIDHPGAVPITTAQGEELRKVIGAPACIECSSKTQQTVKGVFDAAIKAVLQPLKQKMKKAQKGCSILWSDNTRTK